MQYFSLPATCRLSKNIFALALTHTKINYSIQRIVQSVCLCISVIDDKSEGLQTGNMTGIEQNFFTSTQQPWLDCDWALFVHSPSINGHENPLEKRFYVIPGSHTGTLQNSFFLSINSTHVSLRCRASNNNAIVRTVYSWHAGSR